MSWRLTTNRHPLASDLSNECTDWLRELLSRNNAAQCNQVKCNAWWLPSLQPEPKRSPRCIGLDNDQTSSTIEANRAERNSYKKRNRMCGKMGFQWLFCISIGVGWDIFFSLISDHWLIPSAQHHLYVCLDVIRLDWNPFNMIHFSATKSVLQRY